jgi:hypothetical protein
MTSTTDNTRRIRHQRGQAVHELCWGKPYPTVSTVQYAGKTWRFYDVAGLKTFLPVLDSVVLIRDEYEIAYNHMAAKCREHTHYAGHPKFVLTGHEGIGAFDLSALSFSFTYTDRKNHIHHSRSLSPSGG